jgi:uncharacterized membrane-anchored protein
MRDIGILLIVAGAAIVLAGILILLAVRLPWLGHLPGDIHLRRNNWSFSFPLATCILVSIALTVLVNLLMRLFRR